MIDVELPQNQLNCRWHTFYGSDSDDRGYDAAILQNNILYTTGESKNSWLGDNAAPRYPYTDGSDIWEMKTIVNFPVFLPITKK